MDLVTNVMLALSSGIPGLVVAGVTMILMLLALIRKDAGLMVVAALLIIPFAFARGAWTGFPLFVRLLPLFSLGSALFIGRDDQLFSIVKPPFNEDNCWPVAVGRNRIDGFPDRGEITAAVKCHHDVGSDGQGLTRKSCKRNSSDDQ